MWHTEFVGCCLRNSRERWDNSTGETVWNAPLTWFSNVAISTIEDTNVVRRDVLQHLSFVRHLIFWIVGGYYLQVLSMASSDNVRFNNTTDVTTIPSQKKSPKTSQPKQKRHNESRSYDDSVTWIFFVRNIRRSKLKSNASEFVPPKYVSVVQSQSHGSIFQFILRTKSKMDSFVRKQNIWLSLDIIFTYFYLWKYGIKIRTQYCLKKKKIVNLPVTYRKSIVRYGEIVRYK